MYQYPEGYRMAEHTFYSTQYPQRLRTLPFSEHDVQREIGAHVVLGGSVINRYRIRTRCGQARVIITITRGGRMVSTFDLADNDPRVAADVTFDPADLSAYYASIGISRSRTN